MIKKILVGYASIFRSLGRFLLLMVVCIGIGFLIAYPLWKLADSNSELYTVLFCIIFGTILIIFIASRVRVAFKRNPHRFLFSLLRKSIVIAGICISVALVLAWHRIAALFAILGTIAVYGMIAFGTRQEQ